MLKFEPPVLSFTPDDLGPKTTSATAHGPGDFRVIGLQVYAREIWAPAPEERDGLEVAMDYLERNHRLELRRYMYEVPGENADGGDANWVRVLRAIPPPHGVGDLELDDERALWLRKFAEAKRDRGLLELVNGFNLPSVEAWQHFAHVRQAAGTRLLSMRSGNQQAFSDGRLLMYACTPGVDVVDGARQRIRPPPFAPPPVPVGQQLVIDVAPAPAVEVGRVAFALRFEALGSYR